MQSTDIIRNILPQRTTSLKHLKCIICNRYINCDSIEHKCSLRPNNKITHIKISF